MMIVQLRINDIRNGDDAVVEVTQLRSSIRNKYPVTKIGYSSPEIKRNAALSNQVISFNRDIRKLCNDKGYIFIDLRNMHHKTHLI